VAPGIIGAGPSKQERAAFLVNTWKEIFQAALSGVATRNLMPDEVVGNAVKIANSGFNVLMKKSNQFFSEPEVAGDEESH
jgi:hypothetical protein